MLRFAPHARLEIVDDFLSVMRGVQYVLNVKDRSGLAISEISWICYSFIKTETTSRWLLSEKPLNLALLLAA